MECQVILLDPATILLMSTLMAAAMSVVLFSAHRSFPAEIRGLREWAVGSLLMVVGAVLFGLRGGALPDAVPLLFSTSALIWGVGLSLIGTQKFYGKAPDWRLLASIWLVALPSLGYYLVVEPNFAVRVAVFSFLVFVFYAKQALLIAREGERHFSTLFFGVLMLLQALVVLTRGMLAVLSATMPGNHIDLLHPGMFQSVYLACANFMALLLTVAFMTVTTRRLQLILELRSTQDPLTQVLNRRGFADIYARERALMRREGSVMTLISIDLDFFKQINDRFGHVTGDRVLVHVAGVIGKALRVSDHVARFGGEEFVVLLPDTGIERARSVAERIQAVLRAPRLDMPGVAALPAYTVSIGIACQVSAEEDLDGILMRADKALYSAKAHGRDRIEMAETPALPAQAAMA